MLVCWGLPDPRYQLVRLSPLHPTITKKEENTSIFHQETDRNKGTHQPGAERRVVLAVSNPVFLSPFLLLVVVILRLLHLNAAKVGGVKWWRKGEQMTSRQ
jgi:hypothetical protein